MKLLRIAIEPGGEHWLGFAKKKLHALNARRQRQQLPVLNQVITVDPATAIYLKATAQSIDSIRITAATAIQGLYDDQGRAVLSPVGLSLLATFALSSSETGNITPVAAPLIDGRNLLTLGEISAPATFIPEFHQPTMALWAQLKRLRAARQGRLYLSILNRLVTLFKIKLPVANYPAWFRDNFNTESAGFQVVQVADIDDGHGRSGTYALCTISGDYTGPIPPPTLDPDGVVFVSDRDSSLLFSLRLWDLFADLTPRFGGEPPLDIEVRYEDDAGAYFSGVHYGAVNINQISKLVDGEFATTTIYRQDPFLGFSVYHTELTATVSGIVPGVPNGPITPAPLGAFGTNYPDGSVYHYHSTFAEAHQRFFLDAQGELRAADLPDSSAPASADFSRTVIGSKIPPGSGGNAGWYVKTGGAQNGSTTPAFSARPVSNVKYGALSVVDTWTSVAEWGALRYVVDDQSTLRGHIEYDHATVEDDVFIFPEVFNPGNFFGATQEIGGVIDSTEATSSDPGSVDHRTPYSYDEAQSIDYAYLPTLDNTSGRPEMPFVDEWHIAISAVRYAEEALLLARVNFHLCYPESRRLMFKGYPDYLQATLFDALVSAAVTDNDPFDAGLPDYLTLVTALREQFTSLLNAHIAGGYADIDTFTIAVRARIEIAFEWTYLVLVNNFGTKELLAWAEAGDSLILV